MAQRILISRTDNLGDVVLTLPMAGVLKRWWPDAALTFLGKQLVAPLIAACRHVDHFLPLESLSDDSAADVLREQAFDIVLHVLPNRRVADLAQAARIPVRIGTRNRWFHWLTCTDLVPLSRRHSPLHEAQLNLQLLRPLDLPDSLPLALVPEHYGLVPPAPPERAARWFDNRFVLVLHPLSRGSARNWPLAHWTDLARQLPPEHYHLLVTGTQAEGEVLRQQAPDLLALPHVTDTTGQLNLTDLIGLLGQVDGLIAASTGPLHITSALGRPVLGLFPPLKPMHPSRWAPLGAKAQVMVTEQPCPATCTRGGPCACMQALEPASVAQVVDGWRQPEAANHP